MLFAVHMPPPQSRSEEHTTLTEPPPVIARTSAYCHGQSAATSSARFPSPPSACRFPALWRWARAHQVHAWWKRTRALAQVETHESSCTCLHLQYMPCA